MLEVKEFFKEVRQELNELQELRTQRETIIAVLYPRSVGPKEVDVQESAADDKMAETMSKVAELDDVIQYDIRRIAMDQMRAREIIRKVERTEHRQILTEYYLTTRPEENTLEHIANRMHYSYSRVRHMHGEALREAERIYVSTQQHIDGW